MSKPRYQGDTEAGRLAKVRRKPEDYPGRNYFPVQTLMFCKLILSFWLAA